MKKLFYSFIAVFLTINSFAIAKNQPNKQDVGNLTIKIVGLQNNKGDVKIGLFNSEESFNGQGEKFKGTIIKAEGKTIIWEVKNIPFGNYAIKAFHDEDQDDEVDTNSGIPTEGFGFSNNPSILSGPPSYERAKFFFNSDNMKIEIKLINF